MLHRAKHVHAKFQLSSIYPGNTKRHLLPKFKPSRIITKISKAIRIFLTPEFALEFSKFQYSEYEVHQSSPTDEG
jgi:hypothetical protein